MTRRKDASFIAQLFLLSTFDELWSKAKESLYVDHVEYSEMDLKGVSENDYPCYCASVDMRYGSSHTDLYDLSNDEAVDLMLSE